MKTFLLSFLFAGFFSFTHVYAQPCGLVNLHLEKVYTAADGKCYADVFFDLERNNGNKFIYLHLWNKANYNKVDKAAFTKGAGPRFTVINGTSANAYPALATVALDNNDVNNPVFSALNYRPDAAVTVVKGSSIQTSGTPVSGSGAKALYRYSVKAIPLANGGGCAADNIDGIVWSTQANSVNSHIHCAQVGKTVVPFPLTMKTAASCASGLYEIRFDNTTNSTLTGSVDMFAESNTPVAEELALATSEKFDLVGYFLVAPGQSIVIKRPIPAKHLGKNLYSHVSLSNFSTKVHKISTASCVLLPTTFLSFTASRKQQQVVLSWQTASEENVRGFAVQRRTAGAAWTEVAFVSSKATGGTSAAAQAYQHTDVNSGSGITEYRVVETGVNGKTTISETRAVKGHVQDGKVTLYPNPSTTGSVTLAFDNASVRDILVTDMSGRTVKQFTKVTASSLQIENLNNGFYSVQTIDRTTSITTTEKLLIRK